MRIETSQMGAVTVIHPDGPVVCKDDADALRAESLSILGKTLGRFVLDASDMAFVDSNGLEALVDISNELLEGGQPLRLCQLSDTLREIIAITGLTSSFQQYDTVQSAVRSFL